VHVLVSINKVLPRMAYPMIDYFNQVLSEGNFMPHGMCYMWRPDVLALHIGSDALVGLAYISISLTLVYFVRRRKDLQFHGIFISVAIFIVSCGMTHLMEVWTIWHPQYWLSGAIKALTALASVSTAVLLVKLVPQALRFSSPVALRVANAQLERQIAERTRAETDVRHLNEKFEARALDLENVNENLRQTQLSIIQDERLRALGQMASGIAHDINNALTPAIIYSQLLLQYEHSESQVARGYAADIHRCIEDVSKTVSRLHEFARPRESQLHHLAVPVDRLLQQVIDLTRVRWHDVPLEKGIVIEIRLSKANDMPAILGAENEIRDALMNLIFNAVDAMPMGGTLSLDSHVERQSRREHEAHKLPGAQEPPDLTRVVIEIRDNGVGMTDETMQRCREPFFTTKGERGMGLGLAMVHGMAQRHQADLNIVSAPNRGTTVSISFPAATDQAFQPEQKRDHPNATKGVAILVVDDEPRILAALRRVLQADGHRVTITDSGQGAIDRFRAATQSDDPFAIVFADMGMPYLDGRKVASAIKSVSPSTPVVLVTGWGSRMLSEGALPQHVDRLISKPPDLSELRRAVAELTANELPGRSERDINSKE
jgi:signal transduction histidine kinase/CheY-like chemotaxis protein